MKLDPAVVSFLNWETCGDTVVQRARTGTGTLGPRTEREGTPSSEQCAHNVGSFALNVMEHDQSEQKSVFLEDWELARALSHVALDMLCQEMHEAWKPGCCHMLKL